MHPRPVLSYGQFFGGLETQREVGGFSLSLRTPDPDLEVERHTHEEAHFIVLLDGHYVSSARDAGHLQGGPALIYNPPGTTHCDRFEGRSGRFFALSVSRERMEQTTATVPLLPAAVRLARRDALGLAQQLVGECRSWAPSSPLLAEGLCLEMLAEVARRAERVPRAPPGWLRRVRELLRDRCCDELAIAALAEAAGVHPIYLARSFRRFFGCAPAEYLRRCRADRAAALLRDTRRTLVEIALACGFADQSHFCKAFKRTFRVSPGAYRRQVGR